MGSFFGTDGFRGEANVFLTAEHAFRLGCFLGEYCRSRTAAGESCRAVIGKDARRSSYMFEYALAAGLTACGADAYLLHVTTTPSVSYIVRADGFDCGVMISASHNGYADNGIKLLDKKGEKPRGEMLDLAEAYLRTQPPPAFVTGESIGRTVDYTEGRNRYAGYLISLSRFSYRGVKVGLDCANGSSFMLARSVFGALGAQVYCINASPNGLNINRACGSTHPEVLAAFVKSHGLDVGFAFDGDADRCICVDENGNVADGDAVLYMSALYLQKAGELDGDRVVCTVMTNSGLERALAAHGIACERTKVGDMYVRERMRQVGAALGGEPSGHIIYGKYATTGDGILTAVKVMEIMLGEKKRLSELVRGYAPLPQVLLNVPLFDKSAAGAPSVQNKVRQLRREGKFRIVLRPSGTENAVRIFCEGEDAAACRRAAGELKECVLAAARAGENTAAGVGQSGEG